MSTVAVTAIIAKTNKYIKIFRNTQATSPASAILPGDHRIREDLIFNKLVREQILIQTTTGRYYLNEKREYEVRQQRIKRVLIMLAVITVILVISFLLSNR